MNASNDRLLHELTDAVYRCVLEPEGWSQVMALMRRRFPSSAQTFYFLERDARRLRAVCLDGIERKRLADFDALFFAADNPWMRVSERLHRPGIVRTNERLDAVLGEEGALYRCAYYHDWMRPQGFHFTIGNTLLAEAGTIANVTLMRPRDMPTFDATEVRDFENLTGHMRRALALTARLEREDPRAARAQALAGLPQPVAVVRADLGLVYANAAMERLLAQPCGLQLRAGRLAATRAELQPRLAALVARAADGVATDDTALWLRERGGSRRLRLEVLPCRGTANSLLPAQRLAMLVAQPATASPAELAGALVELCGCTRSEARLAAALGAGHGLRVAAGRLGISYESARVYLKAVYRKLDVHDRAQLVGRLARLGDWQP